MFAFRTVGPNDNLKCYKTSNQTKRIVTNFAETTTLPPPITMNKAGATGSCFWAIIVMCDAMQSLAMVLLENVLVYAITGDWKSAVKPFC